MEAAQLTRADNIAEPPATVDPKERIYGVVERCVDLTGAHMRRLQHHGVSTWSECAAKVQTLLSDPAHEASGYCAEFNYWWARSGVGDGHVRRFPSCADTETTALFH